jgi:hypothetical protein
MARAQDYSTETQIGEASGLIKAEVNAAAKLGAETKHSARAVASSFNQGQFSKIRMDEFDVGSLNEIPDIFGFPITPAVNPSAICGSRDNRIDDIGVEQGSPGCFKGLAIPRVVVFILSLAYSNFLMRNSSSEMLHIDCGIVTR